MLWGEGLMHLLRLLSVVSGTAIVLLMATPASVQAERSRDFAHTGPYLGVGGLLSALPYADHRIPGDWDHSLGVSGRIGYRFHRHFSAELEARWHDDFDSDPSRAGDTISASLEPVVFTVNAKVHFMLGRIQPYLLAGYGGMTGRVEIVDTAGGGTSDTERYWDYALRFGGGFDVYVTEHIVVNTEVGYVYPRGEVNDFDQLSFGWGLEYRF